MASARVEEKRLFRESACCTGSTERQSQAFALASDRLATAGLAAASQSSGTLPSMAGFGAERVNDQQGKPSDSNGPAPQRSSELEGRVALVTGGSRGIGRACVRHLAAAGADVVVNFRSSQDEAAAVAEEVTALGRRAIAVRADVSDQGEIAAMVDAVVSHMGRLDIVVSNAAAGGFRTATAMPPAHLEAILRTNAGALAWLAKAAAEALGSHQHNGKIVAISSHGSQWAVPHYAAIGASKAALESLARSLAWELGPGGVNVNVVLPGIVATEAIATMPGMDQMLAAAGERMLTPRRRLHPNDVAAAVRFLCSDAADLVQGHTLVLDGGITIQV